MPILDSTPIIETTFQVAHVFHGADRVRTSRMQNDYDQLNIIRAGVSCIEIDGQTLTAGPGEAVYFPAGTARVEWNDPARPLDCVMVLFFRHTPLPPTPRCVHDAGGRLGLIAQWLLDWAGLPQRPTMILRNTFTAAMVAEYCRLSLLVPPRDVAFHREVMQVIVANYRDPDFRLADLAAAVNLSPQHLVRRFRAAAGVGPMAMLRDWRLSQATLLLQTTDSTVDEIAWRVGLKGQARLSRLLRRDRDTSARELRHRPTPPSPTGEAPGGLGHTPGLAEDDPDR